MSSMVYNGKATKSNSCPAMIYHIGDPEATFNHQTVATHR